MRQHPLIERAVALLKLHLHDVKILVHGNTMHCAYGDESITMVLLVPGEETNDDASGNLMPLDYILASPAKIAALLRTRLGLNRKIFARKCEAVKLGRARANDFIDRYHLMKSASSAWNFGLTCEGELLCVASFSKGRKMNRLREHQRSYELIRFCCREGYSVSGGLSKLVRTFCREKDAAEIMTYVDRQFSDGRTFRTAGFRVHEETPPMLFEVDPETFERRPIAGEIVSGSYQVRNAGNIKMLFECGE